MPRQAGLVKYGVLLFLAVLLSSCVVSSSDPLGYQVDGRAYRKLTVENASIKVSLWDQKAWLVNEKDEAVLVTDIATGVPGKETPQGTFEILERLETKRSNRYGKYVDEATGKVVIEKAWEHDGPPPEGVIYEGISMPYWMRLTWDGVGMHVGHFKKRTRSSFGCIRVYEKAQPKIYEKTQLGTPVEIIAESLRERYSVDAGWF
ncbi:MAG: L,D-transpeptidase [Akkermansiaceae bacterium]